jgi:hypothetical protein
VTTVPPGGLFEYTRRPIFVTASLHVEGEHLEKLHNMQRVRRFTDTLLNTEQI